MLEVITSTANPRIKSIRGLQRARERKARRQALIEGPVVFADFLDAGFTPTTVLCTTDDTATIDACHASHVPFTLVTSEVLAAASDTRAPQSPVAVIDVPEPAGLRLHDTVILVDVADPGNVGTLIRTATALGWDVGVTGATADIWSPKVIRAGAGAHSRAHFALIENPRNDLPASGLSVVATVVSGGETPRAMEEPVALLVGSEAHGVPRDLVAVARHSVSIPMPGGLESLNAAVAGAIAMYAMSGTTTP